MLQLAHCSSEIGINHQTAILIMWFCRAITTSPSMPTERVQRDWLWK
jgi:hypothetical protein